MFAVCAPNDASPSLRPCCCHALRLTSKKGALQPGEESHLLLRVEDDYFLPNLARFATGRVELDPVEGLAFQRVIELQGDDESWQGCLTELPIAAAGEPGVYRRAHVHVFQLIAGHIAEAIARARLLDELSKQRRRAENLLLNVMPERMARELENGAPPVAEGHAAAAVLFVDIVGFTPKAAGLGPEALTRFLHGLFSSFDVICERSRVEKIKTIGDAYMAIAGIPGLGGPSALAEAALQMHDVAARTHWPDGSPLVLRSGMHIGPVVGGVIGRLRFSFDVWGDTVNVASRLEAEAPHGALLVSDEVRRRLSDAFEFHDQGDKCLVGHGDRRCWVLRRQAASDRDEGMG